MIPNSQVPPLREEKRIEHIFREKAAGRAASDPLPGPLLQAFGPQSIRVGNNIVRPCVAYDFVIFKALNSPIHRQMLEAGQDGKEAEQIPLTDQEGWDIAFQFTRSCKEADAYLQQGVEAFKQASKETVPMQMNLAEIAKIVEAAMKQVLGHMQTVVEFVQEEKENGKTDFFVPAVQQTAMAGG